MKMVNQAVLDRAKRSVVQAGKQAARSVGKSIHRAIRVAAEYAVHLHKDDGMPKPQAIGVAARAVIRTVKRG